MKVIFFAIFSLVSLVASESVMLGSDLFFQSCALKALEGKKVALVTNHTGLDSSLTPTLSRLFQHEKGNYQITAIFCPEHGLKGVERAGEDVLHAQLGKIPCYSLHGALRRPSPEMLQNIDVIIYDVQDIGARSYTYATTLYYVMEEAAKQQIDVIVLDRPNPMGGVMVDGPLLTPEFRSFIGYLNIPYCHGMTIGELALFFNDQYQVGCSLQVVTMKGWKRTMSFEKTGLIWAPTSPHIPEKDTPFYYTTTGIIGDLGLVNVGVGYTLPFKVIGAPWIEAERLAKTLNGLQLPGITFLPFYFKPFFGWYKDQVCEGVRLVITDPLRYRPVTTGYLLLGVLKSLYPTEVGKRLQNLTAEKKTMFYKVHGTMKVLEILMKETYPGWKLAAIDAKERKSFMQKRQKYLLY